MQPTLTKRLVFFKSVPAITTILILFQASKVLFDGKYSPEAIKGQYTRAYDTFTHILALEGFTGGGGDGDENSDGDEDPMEKKITLAQSRGIAVGGLTSKTYHKWQNNGWYDLFANR